MTKNNTGVTRRSILAGLGVTGLGGSVLGNTRLATAQSANPVRLSIMDVGGALVLSQPAFEQFGAANRDRVAQIIFTKAPVTELAGKLRASQAAGRVDIDMVLTGSDGLAAGLANDTWLQILPHYDDRFPDLEANYEPAALNLHRKQGAGYGVVINYYPSGPLLEYAPERLEKPPSTAAELLDYARANPGRFIYARPTNSGPGRTFMMGLPYLLGDRDPFDPMAGWDKTWDYLAEIGQYIDYYPAGTGVTMKEFGEGVRDVIVTTTGWDINPRALGIVPENAAIATLAGFHWVSDAFFMCIPKGITEERLEVTLDLMAHLLTPQAQAFAYDEGYLYPGPAIANVPLSMAPQASQEVIERYGRDDYAALIRDNPIELPLPPAEMVKAFRRWDETVGNQKS